MQANDFRHDQSAVREGLFSQATGHTNLVECKGPRSLRCGGLCYLGWLMGLEPTTTGITILDSTN